jgi:RNA polymerase sigma-70 factor, ECF subfamily
MTAELGGLAEPPRVSSDDIEPLVRAISGLLFGIAFRILGNHADAEDAVQNAWIKAMLCWPRVASIATVDEQCAFMVNVAVKEALQIIRKRYRRREAFGTEGKENTRGACLAACGGGLEPVAEQVQVREELRLTWQEISTMPETRKVVVGLYAAGHEYGEIAEMLGIHVSTVGSHISNARKHLRRVLPGAQEGKPE